MIQFISHPISYGIEDIAISIPVNSKIIDINSVNNNIVISYEDINAHQQYKNIFIKVIDVYQSSFVPDNYKFIKSIKSKNIDNNTITSSMGNNISIDINPIIIESCYLIFLDENKQTCEKRDESLKKILNKN